MAQKINKHDYAQNDYEVESRWKVIIEKIESWSST